MSVDSITKSAPAAPSRGTGTVRVAPPRQRTRPIAARDPSASAASEQRARASRAWFLGILLGLLGLGLIALLLLNTASAQDAFRLHDLQTRAADLSRQEQALSLQASVLADPDTLAARAGKLGMVPGGDPRFLAPGAPLPARCQPIADGCVIRGPKPAPEPSPQANGQPSPQASAKPSPRPSAKPSPQPGARPTSSAPHPSPGPTHTQPAGKLSQPGKSASGKTTASSKPGAQAPATALTPRAASSARATPSTTAHKATRQTAAAASGPTPAGSAPASRRAAG